MQPGDPRADPAIVDLIELAGLWVAAEDWAALLRTLQRLEEEISRRFPREEEFHLLKKSEYFPLTAGQLAVEPRKRSSSQGESLHRSKTHL